MVVIKQPWLFTYSSTVRTYTDNLVLEYSTGTYTRTVQYLLVSYYQYRTVLYSYLSQIDTYQLQTETTEASRDVMWTR